jgi:adenylate cyclase class 2
MPATGNREVEIKLRVDSPAAARTLLKRAGFRVVRRRVFESNAVFDTPDARLRGASELLRLRQAGKEATLTFKGPPEAGKHKSREELETLVEDPQNLRTILERLGYRASFLYEKYRTEFSKDNQGVATLDETPIGTFIELEGAENWIDRTASKLGFSEQDYITASYGALYLRWCEEQHVAPQHMTFG